MRMRLPFRGVGVVVLAVFAGYAAGCAGGGSGGGGPLPTYADFDLATAKPRACDALTLSAPSAEPLDQVTISGLPADLGQIAVYLETVAGAIGHLYPTGPVAGGQATFTVPPSPDGDPDGGDVMLTVTNADEACPAVPFTIDALPPAPADYATYMADLADTIQEYLDLVAQVFGTDYATLSAADTPPSEELLPIFLAVKVFDASFHPLPDMDSDADRELVVRLLTRADAPGILQDAIDDLDQYLADVGSFKVAAEPSLKTGAAAPDRSATARFAAGGCTELTPRHYSIPDTQRLSDIMNDPRLGDISGKLDAFGSTMAGISVVTGVADLSAPTDVLGALATVGGTAVEFMQAAAPSAFTSLTFDVESPIWEDHAVPPPAWGNAQAHVTSTPFSVSGAVADNLLALAGMSPVGGWTITVITYSYEDEINQALEDVVGPEGSLCVTVPAQEWGPFDVTSSDWTTSEITGDTITKTTHENYVPAMLGPSEVRVSIRPEKFGMATIVANNFVTVEAKTVSISPISPKVDKPGDVVNLTVSVNAHVPGSIDFTPPPSVPKVAVTHVYQGGGIHSFQFLSPSLESEFPAPFKVVSTSAVVPPTDFERADSVDIKLNKGALEITGGRSCIAPGETVDLEAILTGFDDPATHTVTWTESAGSTAPGTDTRLATYTAPGTLGTVTVRAETPVPGAADPAADEVSMEVSDACMQQFLAVYMQSQADGDPDCFGPFGSRADIGEEAFDVVLYPPEYTDSGDFFLGQRTPAPDAPYFSGAPVTLTAQSSFTEMIPVDLDTCATTHPFARADVVLETTGNAAHWEMHYDNRGDCYEVGAVSGCNVGRSSIFVDHYMYLPIEEPGTYKLTMDLACNLYPHFGGVYLTMSRYIDGAGFPQPPNAGGSPALPRNVTLAFDCTGTSAPQSLVLDLVGPQGSTGTDLITIGYQGAPAGYFGGLTPDDLAENEAALDALGKGPTPIFLYDMDVRTTLERLD